MTHEHVQADSAELASTGRPAGIILGLGSIIMLLFMALHPVVHAHDPGGLVAEMARIEAINAVVHGTLLGNQGLILLGLLGFAERLGLRRTLVRAGLIAAAMGTIALSGAALLNGFILPGLVAGHAGGGGSFEALPPLLMLAHQTSVALIYVGIPAMSAAVLAWSLVLMRRGGASSAIGGAGVICALLPVIALATGHLPINVHGFGAFVLVQSIWYLAIALQMVRGRI